MAHLLTGEPAPWEYIELVLCRDVWHCPPSVLREQQMDDVLDALAVLNAEARARQ